MAPHKAVLDRLSRELRDDVRLHLPEVGADFYLDPRSDLFRRIIGWGVYEPELVAAIERHVSPDRDVVDVGANVGFFTIAAGRQLTTGRVLAIEPTAAAFGRLQRNIALNGLSERAIAERCLVGDRTEQVPFNIIPGREEYSSIGNLIHPNAAGAQSQTETVGMRKLDDLVSEHGLDPGFIKIDVEGAEGLVFAGAEETLAKSRPVIVAEFSVSLLRGFGTEPRAIVERLQSMGYKVTDPGAATGRPCERALGEILAIPL
jgi:FkbM family methyltransferase